MKNKYHNSEQEVEKTMQALDGLERAQADDYFYARLQSRLENREAITNRGWSHSLAYAVVAAFILILFNILTVLQYQQNYGDTDSTREENLQAFTEEYHLDILTIYELNTEE